MDFKQIEELIVNNGLSLVISIIVLYFAIKLGNLGLDYLKKKIAIIEHDKMFYLRTEIDEAVNEVIERAVFRLNACRVYVFEFKNGTETIGGLPFRFMSCTYEALNQGAKTEVNSRQNMSLSLFSSFIKQIAEKEYLIMDVDNKIDTLSNAVWGVVEAMGISKTIRVKLVDKKRNVIGYLGVDYCNGKPIPGDDTIKEYVKLVREYALEIGAYLSVK